MTSIVAREIDAPAGSKPVEWRLVTDRDADTCAEVVELIDWYRARWEIEMLFDAASSRCRLEHIDKLERAIAMCPPRRVLRWPVISGHHAGAVVLQTGIALGTLLAAVNQAAHTN